MIPEMKLTLVQFQHLGPAHGFQQNKHLSLVEKKLTKFMTYEMLAVLAVNRSYL